MLYLFWKGILLLLLLFETTNTKVERYRHTTIVYPIHTYPSLSFLKSFYLLYMYKHAFTSLCRGALIITRMEIEGVKKLKEEKNA